MVQNSTVIHHFFNPKLQGIPAARMKGSVESKDDVIVRADIPGMKKEDIDVFIQDDTLLIK